MEAHLFVHAKGDSFILDANPALQSILQARLERYIIADDVQTEDVTAQLSIFHVIGGSPPNLRFRRASSRRIASVDRVTIFGAKQLNMTSSRPSYRKRLLIVTRIARGFPDRTGNSTVGARTDGRHHSGRSQS